MGVYRPHRTWPPDPARVMSAFYPLRRLAVPIAICTLLLSDLPPLAPSIAHGQVEAATPVAEAFEISGDVGDEDIVYRWDIGESTGQWRIELDGPPDETMRLELSAGNAERLERVDRTLGQGRAALHDLALDPGSWYITVEGVGGGPVAFGLGALLEPERFDPEPNDDIATAAAIEDGGGLRGRLGRTDQDEDVYRLTVPAGEPQVRDITLQWSGEVARRLCLRNDEGRDRKCASGEGSSALLGLLLDPGDHFLAVGGSEDASLPYDLQVERLGAPAADVEAEPNDDVFTASPFEADLGTSGRSSRDDPDFHRVDIGGEPQLWSVRATGTELDRLSWVRGGRRGPHRDV